MISKLRSLSIILCCALSLSAFTGCGRDDNDAVSEISKSESSVQEDKIIEYKTVEPPEGGWTTEEIMNVTYLCDHKLSYPLSIEYLGEDFSLSSYSKWLAKKRLVPASLSYKGNRLANATVVKPDDETMVYNIVLFPDTCEVEDTEPFVINGVKMYDSFEDVLAALGDDYRYMDEDSLMYNDRETNESLYSLFFEEGKLVHINVDFRFEIDLPLYKDLYERNSIYSYGSDKD